MQNNLARARFDLNRISQRATAKMAKIHPDRYWRIENGYGIPTPEERAALSRVLRQPESVLFVDEPEPTDDATAVAHV